MMQPTQIWKGVDKRKAKRLEKVASTTDPDWLRNRAGIEAMSIGAKAIAGMYVTRLAINLGGYMWEAGSVHPVEVGLLTTFVYLDLGLAKSCESHVVVRNEVVRKHQIWSRPDR
ncbi:MAG: hypothetical protein AAF413_00750 [Patescibacteria group bacterium]